MPENFETNVPNYEVEEPSDIELETLNIESDKLQDEARALNMESVKDLSRLADLMDNLPYLSQRIEDISNIEGMIRATKVA